MIQVNDEDGKRVKFKGYCIDLIEEIRKLIGFEYEIYIAPYNNFGKILIPKIIWSIQLYRVYYNIIQEIWTKMVNGTEWSRNLSKRYMYKILVITRFYEYYYHIKINYYFLES